MEPGPQSLAAAPPARGRFVRLWVALVAWLAGMAALLSQERAVSAATTASQAVINVLAALVLRVFVGLDWGAIQLRAAAGDCSDITVRVTKGIGSRGYDAVRVTAVCELPSLLSRQGEEAIERCLPYSGLARGFEHCGRFKQRWTQFHSSTAIVKLELGERHNLRFNHAAGLVTVDVSLPRPMSGVHGIVIGDPCISSRYIPGLCGKELRALEQLPKLLNLLSEVDHLDFIAIVGDAFYDVYGDLTSEFERRLSKKAQRTLLLAVPGNHDFWIFAPQVKTYNDQLGMGFKQWYAQDTASRDDPLPLNDFPPAEHFLFYHLIGDVGFLGFSGAHSYESQAHLFQEACDYFAAELPNQIFLLGHWDAEDLGCQPGMDVPSLFKRLREDGPCYPVARRMRYLMGHTHVNRAMPDGLGFLVGAGGATTSNLVPELGVAYIDTRPQAVAAKEGRLRKFLKRLRRRRYPNEVVGNLVIAKLTLSREGQPDVLPALEVCVRDRGSLRDCLDFAEEIWVNRSSSSVV